MIIIVRPKTQLQFAAQTDSDVYFVYCNCDQQRADHCPNQSAGPLRIKISDRIEFIQIEPGRF